MVFTILRIGSWEEKTFNALGLSYLFVKIINASL
jgi:hypothetical protein